MLASNSIFYTFLVFRYSELHNYNLKICSKQYYKIKLLHQIVALQLSGGGQHNCLNHTRQANAIEQSIYF